MAVQDGIDFLLVEHEKTIDLIQHYDNLRVSLMKFAFSYYSVIGTVAFAIYRYLLFDSESDNIESNAVLIFLGCFLIVAFLVGVASVAMLAQNRRYFVIAARHANTLRGFLFKHGSLASNITSVFPTDPNEPKMLNPKSTHLIPIFLLKVVNSIAFSFSILFFLRTTNPDFNFYFPVLMICGLLVLLGQFLFTKYVFLKEMS